MAEPQRRLIASFFMVPDTRDASSWTVLGDIVYSPQYSVDEQRALITAIYVSIVTITTLGYGDVTPSDPWMQVLSPLEALIGFVTLTALISWFLSVYPALDRKRVFAHRVNLLCFAEAGESVDITTFNDATAEQVLAEVVTGLVTVRNDFDQFPVTYYFVPADQQTSLPAAMPYIIDLAERASRLDHAPEVRFQAAKLQKALEDLTRLLAGRFLNMCPTFPRNGNRSLCA